MEFFPEVQLSHDAAIAIARGLYAVAKCDGLHDRESGLIASFWLDTGGTAQELSDVERQASLAPAELALALHSPEERQLFIKTAILLSWADGKVSPEEKVSIGAFAAALDVSKEQLTQLEAGVKDFLLGHLSHVQNTDALREVAKKLDI